jgi:hypothetical protein
LAETGHEGGVGGFVDVYWEVGSFVDHEPGVVFEDGVAVCIVGSWRCCWCARCWRRAAGRDQG